MIPLPGFPPNIRWRPPGPAGGKTPVPPGRHPSGQDKFIVVPHRVTPDTKIIGAHLQMAVYLCTAGTFLYPKVRDLLPALFPLLPQVLLLFLKGGNDLLGMPHGGGDPQPFEVEGGKYPVYLFRLIEGGKVHTPAVLLLLRSGKEQHEGIVVIQLQPFKALVGQTSETHLDVPAGQHLVQIDIQSEKMTELDDVPSLGLVLRGQGQPAAPTARLTGRKIPPHSGTAPHPIPPPRRNPAGIGSPLPGKPPPADGQ